MINFIMAKERIDDSLMPKIFNPYSLNYGVVGSNTNISIVLNFWSSSK